MKNGSTATDICSPLSKFLRTFTEDLEFRLNIF